MLNQIRNIFTIENLNNVIEWLEEYWWIVLIVGLVILAIIIALPLTYRKKKPIGKIIRRASSRRRALSSNEANAVADAQAGGIGNNRQRVARRRDQGRQPVLTASEFIIVANIIEIPAIQNMIPSVLIILNDTGMDSRGILTFLIVTV